MNNSRPPRPAVFALRALLLLAAFSFARTSEAAPANGCGAAAPAERWVLQQLTAGNAADLKAQFPEERFPESARTIRACFLKRLLTGPAEGTHARDYVVFIIGAVVPDPLSLSHANVPRAAVMESFHFKDVVSFDNARINGDLGVDGSHFYTAASFEGIRVEGDAFFRNTVFDDAASFAAAHTAGNFEVAGSEFKQPEQEVKFFNLTVEGSAYFRKTVFGGPVNFTNVDVKQDFDASGASFTNPTAWAVFYSAKVGRDMLFRSIQEPGDDKPRQTSFKGPVNLSNIDVTKDFDASTAQFDNESDGVTFFSAKTGGNAFFWEASFAGGVNFSKADVGGNFELVRARAANPASVRNFTGMKADLFLIEDSELGRPYWLQGVSYRIIRGASTGELLRFIEGAEYDHDTGPDVYINLENYFQRSGHHDAAKRVHVARKWREGSGLAFSRPLKYLWNWVEFLSSAYGQYLMVSLAWSVVLVVIGAFVFRREEYMVTQDPDDAKRYEGRYHPLWYSLALFLPIVDLPDAKTWMPRLECRKRRIYMRLHIIFGYLLIPVALAAWTGIVK